MRWQLAALLAIGPASAHVGTATIARAEGAGEPRAATGLPVRGIVRPVQQAAIATDLQVPVRRLFFREAQAFRKGETLIAFDCERLEAEHAAMEAAHRETRLALESSTYLEKRGAAGRIDVEIARARADKTGAEVKALAARLKHCTVLAPFDGRVTDLAINEHEMPVTGKALIAIVAERTFEIDLIVSSMWLRRIAVGMRLTYTVDETGIAYAARILRIGAAVDPVSQTLKIIAALDAVDDRVIAGMSGSAVFHVPAGAP